MIKLPIVLDETLRLLLTVQRFVFSFSKRGLQPLFVFSIIKHSRSDGIINHSITLWALTGKAGLDIIEQINMGNFLEEV